MKYELVAGFETHIELATKTKIFCSCTTAFGGAPNSHCCPVCIGLPGTLPKLNREVVNFGIKAGLATHGEIAEISKMDRKNYCCLLYTSPSPRDKRQSRMPSSA